MYWFWFMVWCGEHIYLEHFLFVRALWLNKRNEQRICSRRGWPEGNTAHGIRVFWWLMLQNKNKMGWERLELSTSGSLALAMRPTRLPTAPPPRYVGKSWYSPFLHENTNSGCNYSLLIGTCIQRWFHDVVGYQSVWHTQGLQYEFFLFCFGLL